MESTSGAIASKKLLDTLAVIPVWLLFAICFSVLMIWLTPDFLAAIRRPYGSGFP